MDEVDSYWQQGSPTADEDGAVRTRLKRQRSARRSQMLPDVACRRLHERSEDREVASRVMAGDARDEDDATSKRLRAWLRSQRSSLTAGPFGLSAARLVEQLQQLVSRELDLLVTPLGRPVLAGDQPASMEAAKVAVDERVARLRLVGGAFGEPEVPLRVLLPGVRRVGTCSRRRPWAEPRPTRCRGRTGGSRMSWRARSTARLLTVYDATACIVA